MLAENQIAVEARDFFRQPFTVAELRALLKSLKLTPHEIVSAKSPSYKKLGLDTHAVSDEELLVLMTQEPRLLRRPLIIIDGKPVVGYDKDKLNEIFK